MWFQTLVAPLLAQTAGTLCSYVTSPGSVKDVVGAWLAHVGFLNCEFVIRTFPHFPLTTPSLFFSPSRLHCPESLPLLGPAFNLSTLLLRIAFRTCHQLFERVLFFGPLQHAMPPQAFVAPTDLAPIGRPSALSIPFGSSDR
jgi:hypothetical protein